MGLKAVAAEVVPVGKPKFIFSGGSGTGKTTFALNYPRPYLIDVEGGAVRPEYQKKLKEVEGAYFGKEQGSQDFNAVINELKALATTQHGYKTLIIDSFSALYNIAAAIAEEKVGSDFGKDKKEANRPTRQLMRWIENVDMTVILICHRKDKWARNRAGELSYEGTTFDGYDKLEYILDLWIEIEEAGNARNFRVKKSRISTIPKGQTFPLDYEKFSELYGKSIIERPSIAITLASPEQVTKVKALLETVRIPEATIEKWFTTANVETWEEMNSEQIVKVIDHLNKKIAEANK